MDDFPCTEETDRFAYVGVVYETENIFVGAAGFLLCRNHIVVNVNIGFIVKKTAFWSMSFLLSVDVDLSCPFYIFIIHFRRKMI